MYQPKNPHFFRNNDTLWHVYFYEHIYKVKSGCVIREDRVFSLDEN